MKKLTIRDAEYRNRRCYLCRFDCYTAPNAISYGAYQFRISEMMNFWLLQS